MLLPHIAWADRVWGLPFLTALAPSERYASTRQRRHKKLTDWGRQTLLQAARWLPERDIVAVADSSYASINLLNAVRRRPVERRATAAPHDHASTTGCPAV